MEWFLLNINNLAWSDPVFPYLKMKFSDLLNQPYCARTDIIELESLRSILPDTPEDVIKQVYSDHGRKLEFQEQFKNIEISEIEWELASFAAEKIVSSNIYNQFSNWFNNVKKRTENFQKDGWECIDTRATVINHWTNNGTWLKPPIFFVGELLDLTSELSLVEGHTRVGLLKGLLEHHVLSPESLHQIWLGSKENAEQSGPAGD